MKRRGQSFTRNQRPFDSPNRDKGTAPFRQCLSLKIPEPDSRRANSHQCSSGFGCKRIALLPTLQLIDLRVSFLSPFPLALLRWRLTLKKNAHLKKIKN